MAATQIKCPLCSGTITVQTEWGGMEVQCPLCQGRLRLPQFQVQAAPQVRAVPQVQAAPQVRAVPAPSSMHTPNSDEGSSRRQSPQSIFPKFLYIVLAAASVAGIIWWFSRSSAEDFCNKGHQFYQAGQYTQAVEWFTKAAEQGLKDAQFNLGLCYDKGQGVAQNYAEAVKWYTKAAEQGDARAQYNLGFCYDNGQGVAQNYAEAVKWYTKAANQGFVPSYAALSACYYDTKAYSKAFKWAQKAAEAGDATGMFFLGVMYAQGEGVKADKQMAIQWLTKAANKGFKPARELLNEIE